MIQLLSSIPVMQQYLRHDTQNKPPPHCAQMRHGMLSKINFIEQLVMSNYIQQYCLNSTGIIYQQYLIFTVTVTATIGRVVTGSNQSGSNIGQSSNIDNNIDPDMHKKQYMHIYASCFRYDEQN